MKTPLQQFIEYCNQSSYSIHPKLMEKAIELLPIERKDIEDAVITCVAELQRNKRRLNSKDLIQYAADYIEQTFKTEKE